MRSLPRVSAPRNFTLDPAVYGRPETDRLGSFLPALRVATAITAVLFVSVLVLDLVGLSGTQTAEPNLLRTDESISDADLRVQEVETPVEGTQIDTEMEEVESESAAPAEEPVAEAEAVEVTRVVVETVEVEVPAEAEEEEMAEEDLADAGNDFGPAEEDAAASAGDGAAGELPSPQVSPTSTAAVSEAPLEVDENLNLSADQVPPPAGSDGEEQQSGRVMPEERLAREPLTSLRLAQYVLATALLFFLAILLLAIRRR
jgi:hypothetical protein